MSVILDWTPNTNHSGLYLAQARGYFADAGIDLTIVEPGRHVRPAAARRGQGRLRVLRRRGARPRPRAGRRGRLGGDRHPAQHLQPDLPDRDRSGHAHATSPGHSYGSYGSELEEALIRTLVECDGGDPDAVELTPLSSDDFRIGLTEHQFDTAWVFDAWDTIRLGQIDGLDVSTIPFIDHTDCIPDWYTPLVATSQQHLDDDPELVRDFLAALTHGYEDAIAEPQAAADAIHEAAPEIDEELLTPERAVARRRATPTTRSTGASRRRRSGTTSSGSCRTTTSPTRGSTPTRRGPMTSSLSTEAPATSAPALEVAGLTVTFPRRERRRRAPGRRPAGAGRVSSSRSSARPAAASRRCCASSRV